MNAPDASLALDAALETDLAAAVASRRDELTSLLATLVQFPSLLGAEGSAQDFITGLFQGLGLKTLRFAVRDAEIRHLPGYAPAVGSFERHDNVVGTHRPRESRGRSLILNGHIDVVPVGAEELWTNAPFEPDVKEDRLYGRGAGDMKAGIAAYITAFRALQQLGRQPAAPVFLQSVVEEECTGNGALACLHRGFCAEAAIIPEPFHHTIMCAQVGVMWLQLEVFGRPAHVMNSTQGINAIEAAFALYESLKSLVDDWNQPHRRHPAFADARDPIRLNLGKIQGGEWASSVPTRCSMDLRIGFYPGLSATQARAAVEAQLRRAAEQDARLRGATYRIHYSGFQSEGHVLDTAHPLMKALAAAHERIAGTPARWLASTATTDARVFNLYGTTPATCYGPEAENIHGIDESVSLASTLEVAQVLAIFIARWCGVEKI